MRNLKYMMTVVLVAMIAAVAFAAQDSTLTERELRDPKQLEPWLEANAADAETRLATIESAGVVTLTAADAGDGTGTVTITATDADGDDTDFYFEVWVSDAANGDVVSQTAALSVTTGVQLEEIVAGDHYRGISSTNEVVLTLTTNDTGYVVAVVFGEVYSTAYEVTTE